ncbi:Arrestin domain-containing protein 2 [Chytriomyces hyalinus]|nr:Arrestin domain-containing protein 2 [Chytriomyces hyalinus]
MSTTARASSASASSEASASAAPEWGVHPASGFLTTPKFNHQSVDIVSFTLELDDGNSSTFFEPSQGITGRTILVLSRPMRVGSIKVQVQGIVSGGVAHTLLPNMRSNLPFTCHRHLFLDTITLYPSATAQAAQPCSTLQAGKHTWPFSFRVPPVSILPPTYRGAMGSVRYEAASTLERSLLDFDAVAKPNSLRVVSKKEFCVRSVETRVARRAFETPLFKTVEVPVGRVWKRTGKVDFAVRMPRSGFTFNEQIPFTVDIINHSTDTLHLSQICIEERVTVIYADRSTWGPTPCIRVPFPYAETISATDRSTVRSFRLSLPPLEPQHVVPRDIGLGKSLIWGGMRSRSSSSLRTGGETESAATSNVFGLNASFNTQPLKVAHFITCKLQSASSAAAFVSGAVNKRRAITIEIPIILVTCRRDASLLYQNEGLQALVEEVEREEEERQRRREGRPERRLSLDTLPIYESGGVDMADVIVLESQQGIQLPHLPSLPSLALQNLREPADDDQIELGADQGESNGAVELNEHGLPPGYDAYGFGDESNQFGEEMDTIRMGEAVDSDSVTYQESPRTSLGARHEERGRDSAIADLVSPITVSSASSIQAENSGAPLSYEPPGENVIALAPFVDNNPPSFHSIVPNMTDEQESATSREQNRAHRLLRNSNLSMRSLWSSSVSPSIVSTNQTVSRAASSADIPSDRSFSTAFRRRRLSFGGSRAASRARSIANMTRDSTDSTDNASNAIEPPDLDPPTPPDLRTHRDLGLDTQSPAVSGRSLASLSCANIDRSVCSGDDTVLARMRHGSVSTTICDTASYSPQEMIENGGRTTESPISYRSSLFGGSPVSPGRMVGQRSMTNLPTMAETSDRAFTTSNLDVDPAHAEPQEGGDVVAVDIFPSIGSRRSSTFFATLRSATSRSSLKKLFLKRGSRNEDNSRDGNLEPIAQEGAQAPEGTWLTDQSGTERGNGNGENIAAPSSPMILGNRKWGASMVGRRGFSSLFGTRTRNTTSDMGAAAAAFV